MLNGFKLFSDISHIRYSLNIASVCVRVLRPHCAVNVCNYSYFPMYGAEFLTLILSYPRLELLFYRLPGCGSRWYSYRGSARSWNATYRPYTAASNTTNRPSKDFSTVEHEAIKAQTLFFGILEFQVQRFHSQFILPNTPLIIFSKLSRKM